MPVESRRSGSTAQADTASLPAVSESAWIASRSFPAFEPMTRPPSVDVVVVGAGITGITAAVLLKGAGLKVAVVEAQRAGEGVTGYTSAHLTVRLDCSYRQLLSHFGLDGGRLALQGARAALETIDAFVRDHHIDCGFARVPGFSFTERDEGIDGLREEFEAARRLGVDVSLTSEVPLPFPAAMALRLDGQARFHVRQYLLPLLRSIPGDGSFVFEDTRVVEIEDGEPCVVKTERGALQAPHVVMATHVPLNRLLLQTKVAHYRSYVLACSVGAKPGDALFWDDADPYHYIRMADIGGESLLVVGGEDHKVGQEDDTEGRFEALLSYARERFDVRAVPYRWSAQVAEPVDGLPYLGRNAGSSHVYVGTGYSGTGLTFGTLAALIARDLIVGGSSPWTEVFDATRIKPLAAAKEFVAENVDFPAHFVGDRLKAAPAAPVEEVAPGEGRILVIDGRKRAVFRDASGTAHVLDPVCPHMGCLVAFNAAEKSWDCPCHGSRFNGTGEVIVGPAVSGLTKERSGNS